MLDKICTPAIVYLFLSILSILFAIYNNASVLSILIKWIFVMFWTWILNYICNSGYTTVAWVLVLLPFILLLLIFVIMLEMMSLGTSMSSFSSSPMPMPTSN